MIKQSSHVVKFQQVPKNVSLDHTDFLSLD